MVGKEPILVILIGVTLFVTDFVFGWMTFIFGRFPVVWAIALIVGILGGGVMKGIQRTVIVLIIGVALGSLFVPFIFAEESSEDVTLFGILLVAAIWPFRGTFAFEYEGNIIEELLVGFGMLVLMLVGTPLFYLISLGVAGIGGLIGRYVFARLKWRSILERQEYDDYYQAPATYDEG
jgi:hypothetical protein